MCKPEIGAFNRLIGLSKQSFVLMVWRGADDAAAVAIDVVKLAIYADTNDTLARK